MWHCFMKKGKNVDLKCIFYGSHYDRTSISNLRGENRVIVYIPVSSLGILVRASEVVLNYISE